MEKWPCLPTQAELIEAVEACNFGTENLGFCLSCGDLVDGFEPDARRGECESCGAKAVFGAEECLLQGFYK